MIISANNMDDGWKVIRPEQVYANQDDAISCGVFCLQVTILLIQLFFM